MRLANLNERFMRQVETLTAKVSRIGGKLVWPCVPRPFSQIHVATNVLAHMCTPAPVLQEFFIVVFIVVFKQG